MAEVTQQTQSWEEAVEHNHPPHEPSSNYTFSRDCLRCQDAARLRGHREQRELREERDRLEEALHDRKTWTFDTLLYVADRLLDEFYPDDIFPDVPEEDAKGDPGPQLIRAIRRCRCALGQAASTRTNHGSRGGQDG